MSATRRPVIDHPEIDPFDDPAFLVDPFPFYERIRELAPVAETSRGWVAVNYEDCRELLVADTTRQADPGEWQPDLGVADIEVLQQTVREWIGMSNAPNHRRRRSICEHAFTAKSVKGLRPRIEEAVHELIDEALARGTGTMDLVADFAYALPAMVICDLLGNPREDRHAIRDWTEAISKTYDPLVDRQRLEEGVAAAREVQEYFARLLSHKAKHPGNDLLTHFAQLLERGVDVSAHEMSSNSLLLFHAGHRTTTAVIAGGIYELLRPENADQLAALRADPGRTRAAAQEFLRFAGSVHAVWRIATTDIEVGGVRIPEGAIVVPFLQAACRDPQVYDDAQRFDVFRRMRRQHLAFGAGEHYCLGGPLGKLEIEVAIEILLRRLPDLYLREERPPMNPAVVSRGPLSLQVGF